jgi:hypothetical protein
MEYDNPKDGRQTTNKQRQFISDAICPVCFDQVEWPVIMTEGPDSEGRPLRTYFGYCSHCGAAHVVVQFAREDRWIIHKFRPGAIVGITNPIEISSGWKMMSELPPATPAVLPDKTNAEADNAGIMDALSEMHKAMMSCCSTIELLIRSMAEKRGQSIDD